jgi:hypothetical protein
MLSDKNSFPPLQQVRFRLDSLAAELSQRQAIRFQREGVERLVEAQKRGITPPPCFIAGLPPDNHQSTSRQALHALPGKLKR